MRPLNNSLSESDIKAIAIARLVRMRRITSSSIIANEYRLGGSGIRADLAILDRTFIGVEVKSDRDTLRRLASQVSAYQRYFDRTILVLADKHLPNIRIDLSGVEVWSISDSGAIKTISACKRARPADLRQNLIDLLPSRQRNRLLDPNQGTLMGKAVVETFREYFTNRFKPTSIAFWESIADRSFDGNDMKALSVYKPLRSKATEIALRHASALKGWGSVS
ncbi:sce7726 family protein [Stenotrophomonas lactitubi]|jgi:hypothetical protein|uniref:sce7726 family protein n=1 Tax=Stenotrophomonas lactitubi TaxID=2045214 RepID=UPI00224947E5|nr:sce7726 family protein [Stenotrophomonas lactitubi]MCX2895480.1 sce7726 family protein [Stenotrophomonas lactitubi]